MLQGLNQLLHIMCMMYPIHRKMEVLTIVNNHESDGNDDDDGK